MTFTTGTTIANNDENNTELTLLRAYYVPGTIIFQMF